MTHLTPDSLAALRALMEAATAGPWAAVRNPMRSDSTFVCYGPPDRHYAGQLPQSISNGGFSHEDGEFIAALRNAAPALLAAAEENARLREALAKLIGRCSGDTDQDAYAEVSWESLKEAEAALSRSKP